MAQRLSMMSHQVAALALRQPRLAVGGSMLVCIVAVELLVTLL